MSYLNKADVLCCFGPAVSDKVQEGVMELPRAWKKTDWKGGDECLGEAISTCGEWRLVRRRVTTPGKIGNIKQSRWFIQVQTPCDGVCDWNPYRRREVFEWPPLEGAPSFRLLTDAKKCLTLEGMIQFGRERGLL